MWATPTNCEARVSVLETWLSRCSKISDRELVKGVATANASAGSAIEKNAAQVLRSILLVISPKAKLEVANLRPIGEDGS